jgi:hypothetical protein
LAISVVVRPQMVRSVKAMLGFLRQGRMAAGEDQAQDVVFQRRRLRIFGYPLSDPMIGHEVGFDLPALGQKPHVTPQAVDRLMTPDIDQPGAGICRDAFAWPLMNCCCEGILHGILGELEVAEQPDQRGQHAATFVAEQKSDLIRHDPR